MSTIRVTGKGAVHVVPDVTRIEITIDSIFLTYDEAYSQAKENVAWMGKILVYNKLKADKAKTTRLDISDYTESEYDKNGHYKCQMKKGYALDQRIKVDIGMDKVLLNNIIRGIGKFIPAAQINIGYTIQDERPHQLKMLGRAVSDAKEKAEIMAKAAGCKLGDVETINYGCCDVHVYSQARNIHSCEEAKASTTEGLDITPDDLVMSDEVEVTWQLVK